MAGEYEGKAVIGKLDMDAANDLGAEYKVEYLPTLIFFKDGQEVDRVVGAASESDIADKLDALIGG